MGATFRKLNRWGRPMNLSLPVYGHDLSNRISDPFSYLSVRVICQWTTDTAVVRTLTHP